MEVKSLVELFKANEQELKDKLVGFCLPRDAEKIQEVVNAYFEEILDREGLFRQYLTRSEEDILEAAITLLDSQQLMYGNILKVDIANSNSAFQLQDEDIVTKESANKIIQRSMITGTIAGMGSAVFSVGSWGTLFITIAATSIAFYVATNRLKKSEKLMQEKALPDTTDIEINVDEFVLIIYNICEKIDNLINTFRAKIKKEKNRYADQEKVSLEKDYRLLLGSIQSMLGACYSDKLSEEYWDKLKERVEDVGKILENYGIKVVMYSSEVRDFFEIIYRENIDNPNMRYPAFVKDGIAIMKGKVVISK